MLPNKARYTKNEKVQESVESEVAARIERGPKTRMKKSAIDGMPYDNNYEWEAGDYVIVQLEMTNPVDGKPEWIEYRAQVTGVKDNLEYGQDVTVMIQGHTIVVKSEDVRPDPNIYVQRNRFIYAPEDPRLASREGMGINPDTRLTDQVKNDDYDYTKDYNDLNQRFVLGFLMHDGNVVSLDKMKFSLDDISESKKVIRALNEDSLIEVPIEDVGVEEDEWPWAVIVNGNDESDEDNPLRKVRVEPLSFVNAATPESLVRVKIKDIETKMMKKHLRMLS